MNGHLKAFLILIFVGIGAIVAAKIVLPLLNDEKQVNSSDAANIKGNISVAIDNWAGYIPLCSSEMKQRMRQSGYILECVNDGADYPQRMKNLKKGNIDFAVATIDSYLLNAERLSFPGTIISVIDESKGGDAVVAWKDKIKTIDDLKKTKGLKISFTPDSPSEHLLKSIGSHFDVPTLIDQSGSWRVEEDGSEMALKALLDKKVQAAVLWEPDVSKALAKDGIIKLLGTEDTNKLIVDILIANRDYLQNNPKIIETLLTNYFKTLKHYKANKEDLIDEIKEQSNVDKKTAEKLIDGIEWVNLTENARDWFGVNINGISTNEGIIDAIDSTIEILIDCNNFSSNPIPDNNPYRITNSQFIETIYNKSVTIGFGNKQTNQSKAESLEKKFSKLSDSSWNNLKEIGTLKIHPISFQSGTSDLNYEGKIELDKAVKQLKHYPNFRVMIKGHTGLRGDKEANKILSQDRADSVARYLEVTYGIDENRLKAVGYGASAPLPKKGGESNRSYNYRLPRVELFLVAEEL